MLLLCYYPGAPIQASNFVTSYCFVSIKVLGKTHAVSKAFCLTNVSAVIANQMASLTVISDVLQYCQPRPHSSVNI